MDAQPEDFSSELIETLYSWHGGQGSGVYAVASRAHSGHEVPVEVVERAARELNADYKKVKVKGSGYTKAEKDQLATAIDMLEYIARSREAGHEPV